MGVPHGKERFGSTLGTADGVHAYSTHYTSMRPAELLRMSSYHGVHYCGVKYQCVEYARRWLIQVHGVTFESVRMAYDIMDLTHFTRIPQAGLPDGEDDRVHVVKVRNGEGHSTDSASAAGPAFAPGRGDVLLWHPEGHYRKTGHVAIVVDQVTDERGRVAAIRVAEQNVTDASWGGRPYARELAVRQDSDSNGNATYAVHDPLPGARVLGWVRPSVQRCKM
jgi:glutathionylspermidine amidase/synthetase